MAVGEVNVYKRYRLSYARRGLCTQCGEPKGKGVLCVPCQIKRTAAVRRHRASKLPKSLKVVLTAEQETERRRKWRREQKRRHRERSRAT